MYSVAPNSIFCPACGSNAGVLGETLNHPKRVLHHCRCHGCLLLFDRIVAPNGKGVTVLYAVPSRDAGRPRVHVVPDPAREGVHAS